MNRTDLQDLAEERIRDAEALLNAGQWSGAYYLAGYAVECGLNACIARMINQHDFPDKELAQKAYSHSIASLIVVAGLETLRKADADANQAFGDNWLIVRDWDEKSRYRRWTELEARNLYAAITDATDGVLPWIRGRW